MVVVRATWWDGERWAPCRLTDLLGFSEGHVVLRDDWRAQITIFESSKVAVLKMVGSFSYLLGLRGEQREEIGFRWDSWAL